MTQENKFSSVVSFAPGMVIAYGRAIDTVAHQHTLWQLCFPGESCELNGITLDSPFIIEPNEVHKLNMPCGWIILAEPESLLGEIIAKHSAHFPKINANTMQSLLSQLSGTPELVSAINNNPYHSDDQRILKLLDRLDQCLTSDCLKPEQWRAKEIANWLAISQSRFLHLAKDQLGMTWRSYLLWRRLICAIQSIKAGANVTQAAYIAGFSDGAHLCRTIKKTFGMTSKQVIASFQ